MRLLAGSVPGQFQKNPLVVLGAIVVMFLVAYELAQYVIAGDFTGLTYIALATIVGAAMLTMRCLELAKYLIARDAPVTIERGGRKAHAV